MSTVVNLVSYVNGQRERELKIDEISDVLKKPDHFVWIGLHEPTDELLGKVQHEFGLHELAIEDARHAHQRPKLEMYGDSLFIVMRPAQVKPGNGLELAETHLFIGQQYFVSVRHGETAPYSPVRARCETKPKLLRHGPSYALYAVMDYVVDQYFPVVDAMEEELQKLEEQIFSGAFDQSTTKDIYNLKRDLIRVKQAISPLIDICNRLIRFEDDLIAEEMRHYFRDVYDHVIRINEMVDTLRELLTTVLEANFSLISISQNDIVKKISSWAAIFAIPTMIAGIYGMNFKFMPELSWPFGYPLMLGITLGLCFIVYRLFKRSGWL